MKAVKIIKAIFFGGGLFGAILSIFGFAQSVEEWDTIKMAGAIIAFAFSALVIRLYKP